MEQLKEILLSLGIFTPIIASFGIFIEAFLSFLPLSLFITINFIYLGNLIGFIISYIFTVLGSYIFFLLVKNKLLVLDNIKKENKATIDKFLNIINKLPLELLCLLLAIPFTPVFWVNIAAGLAKIDEKKYLIAILIGKIFTTYFWGFVGTNLIDSISNPSSLIKLGIMLILALILSLISKKYIKVK